MAMAPAVWIELTSEERAQLEAWARRRASAAALGGPPAVGAQVALAVCRASPGWVDRRAAAGAAADGHRRTGRSGDREAPGGHAQGRPALVDAVDGLRGRADAVGGPADLAGVRSAAPSPGDLE